MSLPRRSVFFSFITLLVPIAAACSGSGFIGGTASATPPAETYTAHTFDFAMDDSSPASKVEGAQVSAGFFGAAGVQPMLGRTTTPADYAVGSVRPIVILGYDVWAQRFGSDATLLGRTILLDGKTTTIIGIMPKGFSVPAGATVWTTR